MIRVAALTSGKQTPSSRFRVRQHIPLLKNSGVLVDEYFPIIHKDKAIPGLPKSIVPRNVPFIYAPWLGLKAATRIPGLIASWQHDITWLERELIPGLYTLERFIKKPIVFDVDDAIWMKGVLAKKTSESIARRANIIIAGNQYLADWYQQYNPEIRIVPTAIDTDRFKPNNIESKKFIIGWTGTHGNLPYLTSIEPALKRLMDEHQDVVVRVICNQAPQFSELDPQRVEFIKWTAENEVREVQKFSVGVMPLPDDEWTRGKCSFKMLQYMSCAVPVIVSPVGMNSEVLAQGNCGKAAADTDSWYEQLLYYYLHHEIRQQTGQVGREIVEKLYSHKIVAQQLSSIFKELAG